MTQFSIGQIAEKTGMTASAIRYYERIGLLPSCERINGKRRYDETIFQKLTLIQLAKAAGLSIEEIQTLLHEFPENTSPSIRWNVLARKKLIELDERLAEIHKMKAILKQTLGCTCPTMDDCASGDEILSQIMK